MRKLLDGNHTAAYAAYLCDVKFISAYPITPQTQIVEKLSEMIESGYMKAKFMKVESEYSALAACMGASFTGVRAFTATSSQGLLFMHELLTWSAGARLPLVMVNVNRALAPGWNIWTDQLDALLQRDTGWIQIYCMDNQDILDSIIIAFKVSEKIKLPSLIVMDAFYMSHTREPVEIPEKQSILDFIGKEYKGYLSPDDPFTLGNIINPDYYEEFRFILHRDLNKSLELLETAYEEFEKVFGRRYFPVLEYNCEDAETIIVATGSIASSLIPIIEEYNKKGEKIGLAVLRVFRPFPFKILERILSSASKVGIIDRNVAPGMQGIFFTEIASILCNWQKPPQIYDFIVGLGGRDVGEETLNKIIQMLVNDKCKRVNWVDLKDEVII